MRKAFMAYENETDSFVIDELSVENHYDQIRIYGSLNLTKDQAGLARALKLKRIIDASIYALRSDIHLPERIGSEEEKGV